MQLRLPSFFARTTPKWEEASSQRCSQWTFELRWPQQSPPLQPGPLNTQPVSPSITPPPSIGGAPTLVADPRVIVSSEGGLDFATEGTGTPENLTFFADLTISITKTEVVSNLSVQSVAVEPLPNPYFSAALVGNARESGRKGHEASSCPLMHHVPAIFARP
ncbi:hypothetical protein BJV78DRAFT_203699 [Lactifluus subvellereus]|nr:hypothetical protein BJV78DRAFT_203699 [Lactifluus subvellereus]